MSEPDWMCYAERDGKRTFILREPTWLSGVLLLVGLPCVVVFCALCVVLALGLAVVFVALSLIAAVLAICVTPFAWAYSVLTSRSSIDDYLKTLKQESPDAGGHDAG